MATITPAIYNDELVFESAQVASARRVDFVVDFANITYASEDDIRIARLPGGTVILGATIEQVVPAASGQNGTLTLRAGTTAVTAAIAGDATNGTFAAGVGSACPLVVPAGGSELNLLANDDVDVRTSGVIRVVVVLMEGARPGRVPRSAPRDALAVV